MSDDTGAVGAGDTRGEPVTLHARSVVRRGGECFEIPVNPQRGVAQRRRSVLQPRIADGRSGVRARSIEVAVSVCRSASSGDAIASPPPPPPPPTDTDTDTDTASGKGERTLSTSHDLPAGAASRPAASRPHFVSSNPDDGGPSDDPSWSYEAPPNMQRTFTFAEDGLRFSSEFDSGNLVQVERLGPLRYNCYVAPDCANSQQQTNNKQWFHFAIQGGTKRAVLTLSVISVVWSKMYSFSWTPCVAVTPHRPNYVRMNTKVTVTKLDAPLPTPGYPDLMPRTLAARNGSGTGTGACSPTEGGPSCDTSPLLSITDDSAAAGGSGARVGAAGAKPEKPPQYVTLTFEYKFDADCPVGAGEAFSGPAVFIASNHPYSYAKLQRHIAAWKAHAGGPPPCTSASCGSAAAMYFHHEVLCRSLDGHNVDLLTITGADGLDAGRREPMLSATMPSSSAAGDTARPFSFPQKPHVVLTARVHPGEAPASHILHGVIEMLLSRTDPRAAALREHFVFVIVPMINPDGVVRGHSRADATGQNLNRRYRDPSERQHPAIWGIKALLRHLHGNSSSGQDGRLALFIDMHAHANKRGAFFYGNAMGAEEQVRNLLFAKLVSLNSAHFDFPACNFSEGNMFAMGKNGEGKDSSSRVTLFQDSGLVHCYTLESSYVSGTACNAVAALPAVPGEEIDTLSSTPPPRYTPATFAEVGRGLMAALLDLHGLNPCSRLPATPFASVRGVATWVQRALVADAWEQLRRQQLLRTGQSFGGSTPPSYPVGALGGGSGGGLMGPPPIVTATSSDPPPPLDPGDLPAVITTRPSRVLPPTTTHHIARIAGTTSATPACGGAAHGAAVKGAGQLKKRAAGARGGVSGTAPSSAESSRVFVAGAGLRVAAAAAAGPPKHHSVVTTRRR